MFFFKQVVQATRKIINNTTAVNTATWLGGASVVGSGATWLYSSLNKKGDYQIDAVPRDYQSRAAEQAIAERYEAQSSNQLKKVAITGGTGTGKTLLAQKATQDDYSSYYFKDGCFYYQFTNDAVLEPKKLRELYYHFAVENFGFAQRRIDDIDDETIREAKRRVDRALVDRRFMLVFDNVRSLEELQPFLPSDNCLKGRVLVTTTSNTFFPDSRQNLSIDGGVEEKVALQILGAQHTAGEERQQAKGLVDYLDANPEMLTEARVILQELPDATYEQFPRLLEEATYPDELEKLDSPTQREINSYAAYRLFLSVYLNKPLDEVSLVQDVPTEKEMVLDIFNGLVFLNLKKIPVQLIDGYLQKFRDISDLEELKQKRDAIIKELARWNFISHYEESTGLITIHNTIAARHRWYLAREAAPCSDGFVNWTDFYLHKMLDLLCTCNSFSYINLNTWRSNTVFIHCVESLLEHVRLLGVETSNWRVLPKVQNMRAIYYGWQMKLYIPAKEALERALTLNSHFCPNTVETITLDNAADAYMQARILCNLGSIRVNFEIDRQEAIRYMQQALAIGKRLLEVGFFVDERENGINDVEVNYFEFIGNLAEATYHSREVDCEALSKARALCEDNAHALLVKASEKKSFYLPYATLKQVLCKASFQEGNIEASENYFWQVIESILLAEGNIEGVTDRDDPFAIHPGEGHPKIIGTYCWFGEACLKIQDASLLKKAKFCFEKARRLSESSQSSADFSGYLAWSEKGLASCLTHRLRAMNFEALDERNLFAELSSVQQCIDILDRVVNAQKAVYGDRHRYVRESLHVKEELSGLLSQLSSVYFDTDKQFERNRLMEVNFN